MIMIKVFPDSLFATHKLLTQDNDPLVDSLVALAYQDAMLPEGTTLTLRGAKLLNGFVVIDNDEIDSDTLSVFVLSGKVGKMGDYLRKLDETGQAPEDVKPEDKDIEVIGTIASAITRNLCELVSALSYESGSCMVGSDDKEEEAFFLRIPNAASVIRTTFLSDGLKQPTIH